MDNISDERKMQRQILAGVDAQIALSRLEAEAAELRERFRQWFREAEIGLRWLLDGGEPPLCQA